MALQNSLATIWKTRHPPTGSMGGLPVLCLFEIVETIAFAEPSSQDEPTSTYTLKQLSLVDKELRHLCLPFLFTVGDTRLELNRSPNEMHEHVQALRKAPLLIRFSITDLRLELFPNRNGHDGIRSGEADKDLVACLGALQMLNELHVDLANDLGLKISRRQGFERPLQVKKLRLSGVYKAGALILACPYVRHLSITCDSDRDWKRALGEIRYMKHLICVELVNFRGWTPALLTDLYPFLSLAPHLALKGRLDGVKLTDLAPFFLQFPRLETLAITDTQRMAGSYLALFKENNSWPEAVALAQASHPDVEDPETVALRYFGTTHGSLKSLSFLSYPRNCNEKEWTFHIDGDNVILNEDRWTRPEPGPGVVRVQREPLAVAL